MAREAMILRPVMRAGGGGPTRLDKLAGPVALENDLLFPRFGSAR